MSGIAEMEAKAEEALTESRIAHAEEERAYAERRNSPEVQLLNDRAELIIYGSGRRSFEYPVGDRMAKDPTTGRLDPKTIDGTKTYKYGTGDRTYELPVKDPDTGEVKLKAVATPDKPFKGRIDQILESHDPKYGRSELERAAMAKDYVDTVDSLLDEGFELTQAKMIMDLREKGFDEQTKLVAKFMGEGMNGHDAHVKADEILKRADEKRKKFIKETGLFSMDEYETVLAERSGTKPKEPETVPPMPEVKYPKEWLAESQAADDEYVKQRQKMSVRAFPTEKQKERLQKAWERRVAARDRLGGVAAAVTREYYKGLGLDEKSIDLIIVSGSIEGQLLDEQRLAVKIAEAQIEASKGKALHWFYEKWASWGLGDKLLSKSNVANLTKKVASMGIVGAAVGLPTAVVGGFLLGPIAGGAAGALLATRVARGFLGHKVNKEADAIKVAEAQANYRTPSETREALTKKAAERYKEGNYLGSGDEWTGQEKNIDTDVSRNRRRLGGAVVAGALGFGLAYGVKELADGIIGGGGGHTPNHHPQAPKPTPPNNPPAPKGPDWTPHPTDNRFEWTHASENYGGPSAATPENLHFDDLLRHQGFEIRGNGADGGFGAYEYIRTPDGRTFTPSDPNFHGVVNYYHDLARFFESQSTNQTQ